MTSGTNKEIVELLKSYSVCKRFIQAQEYAKEYFDTTGTQEIAKKEPYEARMHVIESLIQLLEPSGEYTLLHLHYINDIPIEKCAECLSVSRSTAFRMLSKAHETICALVSKKGKEIER